MKVRFYEVVKKLFSCNGQLFDVAFVANEVVTTNSRNLDIQEEYANAFRTESYNEFWTRVLALNKGHLVTYRSVGATTAARLPSYRLFAEQLLDPNHPTVIRILDLIRVDTNIFSLLSDYFSSTADTFHLCGLLLKDIDRLRTVYQSIKDPLKPSHNELCQQINHLPTIFTRVTRFSKSNPFIPSGPSLSRFQAVQASCSNLVTQLESRRNKTQSKIRLLKKLKSGSAVFLVALTASLIVIVASHGFIMLVAGPGVIAASIKLISIDKLSRWSTQHDAAVKGTYIIIRELDTISRLVTRLNNEMEHVGALMQLWLERGVDNRLQASGEMVCSQLKKNDQIFMEQLDELEEHLYLGFMTINRARNLVIKEFLNSRNPT